MSKIPVWSKFALILMALALALKVFTMTFWAESTVRELLDWVFVVIGFLAAALYLGAGARGLAKARRHEYPQPSPGEAPDDPRKRILVSSSLRLSIALMGLLSISGTFVSAVRSDPYETDSFGWGMETIEHLPVILLFAAMGFSVMTVVWASKQSSK
ncbi:hypothetical protein SAMN05216276_109115 [Streptosporangium subroseum]|uniref:Uncharacterized protein n=1 Tax=Streptosporangium subroseum TaxID=106412 RepID=A0A239P5R5_9ACTN|nr:hypothetical protein [Streptosporangium subroseum]SNT62455.1 hypothetical protein SAMN05216276_109115 [Streptosporangium subroseum]